MEREKAGGSARSRARRYGGWASLAMVAGLAAACGNTMGAPARTRAPATAVLAGSSATRAVASSSITTYHYDNARDGVGPSAPSLRRLVKAWTNPNVAGAVYAEPLIYSGSVYVATEGDYLYSLSTTTGKVHWRLRVGNPAQSSSVQSAPGLGGCGDIYPLGVTGTPVIDTANKTLYLAEEVQKPGTSGWRGVAHYLVAVSLSRHKMLWKHSIDPPHAGNGSKGTYIVAAEQQRSALTLSRGRVYVPFGGLNGDCSAYHGYVVSRATNGRGGLTVYKTGSPREDAIWATSGAATSSTGNLFVATGNGANGPGQRFDYGNSVVKLSPGLKVLGHFAPASWAQLNSRDLDLGSDGPTMLPGGTNLFQTGKAGLDNGNPESWGYLLRTARLGGTGRPMFRGQVCPNGEFVFGANAAATLKLGKVARTMIFVPCPSGTVGLEVTKGTHRLIFHRVWQASTGDANGPPILAGGLVWALSTGSDGGGGPGDVLSGMSPITGKVLVSRQVGPVENFATPAAADGLIVVGTSSGVEAFKG